VIIGTEWLAFVFHIRDVPGLNLGREARILSEAFAGFPQYFQVNAGMVT
jgi:hypothetical protein